MLSEMTKLESIFKSIYAKIKPYVEIDLDLLYPKALSISPSIWNSCLIVISLFYPDMIGWKIIGILYPISYHIKKKISMNDYALVLAPLIVTDMIITTLITDSYPYHLIRIGLLYYLVKNDFRCCKSLVMKIRFVQ